MSGGIAVPLAEVVSVEAYSALNARAVTFKQIAPATRDVPPAPAFTLGAVPAYLMRRFYSEFDCAAPGCYSIHQGRVTSDGVVLHRRAALWTHAFNHPDYHVRMIVEASGWNRAALPVRYVPGRAAVIHGPGYAVYGHWLVDFLPRLFVLAEAGHDLAQMRFVLPADLPGFAREFLQMAGIPSGNLLFHDHDREQLLFDELMVPTVLRTASRLHPLFRKASDFWMARAAIPMPPAAPARKILISRAGVQSGRVLTNRSTLEGIAAAEGFEILRPETLPIRDQISLFRHASDVIGEYGSGLHGTVFAPPGQRALVLRGTSIAPGFVQSGLAAACGHRLGYVFGSSEAEAVDYAFRIEEEDFRLALDCLRNGGPAAPMPAATQAAVAAPSSTAPVILLRTQGIDDRLRAMAARLKRETGWRVAFVLDCMRGEPAAADDDTVVRLTPDLLHDLGVLPVQDAAWRCGDYAFYAARRHFPDAAFLWMIEPDVRIHFARWNDFFRAFDGAEDADLLVAHLERAGEHHAWRRTMLPFSDAPFTCMYPVLRLSKRAIDCMLTHRQTLTRRFETEVLADGSARSVADWPNDEIFTATTLQHGGFLCRDLNEGGRHFYDGSTFSFVHLISERRLDALPPDSMLHHPVEQGTEFMRKLRGRFEHIRDNGGPAPFIRDLFDRQDLYEDIRLECGRAESERFMREVSEAIARLS